VTRGNPAGRGGTRAGGGGRYHSTTELARCLEFRGGLDKAVFLTDLKTQAVVLHELPVLGEGARRLSAAFREEHRDVPWKAIAGMRDRLLHGYDDVDLDLVWKTVDEDVPALVKRLEELAPRRES
jgi:uncharacterized protein with HEPN domain